MATTLMLLNAKIATYVGAIAWRWDPVTLVDFVSGDLDGESWYYNGASPITANITIDLDGQCNHFKFRYIYGDLSCL
jgi:hypothetical protein